LMDTDDIRMKAILFSVVSWHLTLSSQSLRAFPIVAKDDALGTPGVLRIPIASHNLPLSYSFANLIDIGM